MPNPEAVPRLTEAGRRLELKWADGRRSLYHALWLRDNCPCPECRHPSGQRLVDSFAIPADIQGEAVAAGPGGTIEVTWAGGGHVSRYDPAWLRANDYSNAHGDPNGRSRTLWKAETLGDRLPRADYAAVRARPEDLRDWLAAIEEYGFAILHGVPPEPGMVTKVVELFGYVRETNYGRLFDVKSVINPNNLAYTGLTLGAHTDNPYRDPTPTVQLLHCLQSSATGGENTLVDGFQVAEDLLWADPQKFHRLARQPVRYRFQDEAAVLASEVTILTLDAHGRVTAVRLNNRSLAPLNLPAEEIEPFYEAYRTFAGMLESPDYRIQFKLEPGDLFIVDNLRVLHGRAGYSGAGSRRLQGCYADMDSLRSRLAVLRRAAQ